MATFAFDNSFVRELPGFYVDWPPDRIPEPVLLYFNRSLADTLGFDPEAHTTATLAALFSGNALPEGAEPVAQVYAGHQFGHFSPRLGDGRALLMGEVKDRQGQRYDLSFKGSGRTPYSRNGDGKAAVGPMLREVLMGEAMQALGIPTTRALAVVATGQPVYRDRVLPGAILTRVAASHIRVGTFQYFAARGEHDQVKRLADYTLARHDPEALRADHPYRAWLAGVTRRQACLLARWMSFGFIHGVMNTDNMSIAGETLDYGPCAFMEAYDPDAVFSSIDADGRYAYRQQPRIAVWNLSRLAETLLPLLDADRDTAIDCANEILESFAVDYQQHWLALMRQKLGLNVDPRLEAVDRSLAEDWLTLLQTQRVDFTLGFRQLARVVQGQSQPLLALFRQPDALQDWLARWQQRAEPAGERVEFRVQAMNAVNPWIIPRNHRVEEALAAASDEANPAPFERLLQALRRPYDECPDDAAYAEPAPEHYTARYQTFCGT